MRPPVTAALGAALGLIALLPACGKAAPKPTISTPSGLMSVITPPLLEAACRPKGTALTLVGRGLRFHPSCVAAPANAPLTILFANQDTGVRHNVVVLSGPRGYSTNPPALFRSPVVKGPSEARFRLSRGLPAGLLQLICLLHPDVMRGDVPVAPAVEPSGGRTSATFLIRWATPENAPPGYVFDVQIERPGVSGFSDWRTLQSVTEATFVPDAGPGRYSFRVAIYPKAGELRPVGYSPESTITVG